MFRKLEASEIDCRVAMVDKKEGSWFSLLLYKDARCDMNILDETVGPMGWKREHLRENKNCVVSIYDAEKGQWVSKEDTGTESNTEQEKGLASDSFKRACVNWGIGRELYSAPAIFLTAQPGDTYQDKKTGVYKASSKVRFHVYHIAYEGNNIVELGIKDSNNKTRFKWAKESKA